MANKFGYPGDKSRKWTVSGFSKKQKNSPDDALHDYYNTEKIVINGIEFTGKLEVAFYNKLSYMKNIGLIKDFKFQVRFELIPTLRLEGKNRANSKRSYIADFVIMCNDDKELIVDAKGYSTDVFKLKKSFFEYRYKKIIYVIYGLNALDKLIIGGVYNGK